MQQNNAAGANALPYKTIKDGWGTDHKIIDFDELESRGQLPREGIIIFEATTRKNESRATDIPHKMTVDKLSKVELGRFGGIDNERKGIKWIPTYLGKSKMFNLEIREEAEDAWILQRSNIVEGSPNLSTSIKLALFRVHDELKEATLTIKRINEGQRAIEIAKGLLGEDLISQARNIGVNTEHANHAIILAQVMKRAQENPEEFLRVYENPNRDEITVFNRGVQTGIINHDPITGYFFRGVPLGPNESFAVEYFKKHKDIMSNIDMMSRERSKKPSERAPVVDPEKESMQKQIEELRKQLSQKNESSEDLQAEFAAVYAEAEAAKVKPLHNYKPTRESIDKLKAAISKVKEKEVTT